MGLTGADAITSGLEKMANKKNRVGKHPKGQNFKS